MNPSEKQHRFETILSLFAPLVALAALLGVGLGGFGLFEPHETSRLQRAAAGGDSIPFADALAALGAGAFDSREVGARLPSAILAFAAALAVGIAAFGLRGPRFSLFAILALASSPVFLFHGRQVTGGAPFLAGEAFAFAGLALLAFGDGRKKVAAGAILAVLGLVLGVFAAGVLMGLVVPAGAAAVALGLSRDSWNPLRKAVFGASSALVVLGGALYVVAIATGWSSVAVTGVTTPKPAVVDSTAALGQLAYGWFPWSALLPLLLAQIVGEPEDDKGAARLRALVFGALAVGLVAQTIQSSVYGLSPLFLALPVCFGVALVLDGLERMGTPQKFASLVAVVAALVMARDFAQQPVSILTGYAFPALKTPDVFKPFAPTLVAAVPFLVLALVAGFVRGGDGAVRRLRVRVLAAVAALVFGGYVAFFLVPGLAVHFSPKHAAEAYERFATDGEPLAVFGAPSPVKSAKTLASRQDLVSWLSRNERVFALFPPRELAELDKELRAARKEHVHVLDMKSTRLILATSKPSSDEKNVNPIAADVRSEPFAPGPANPMQVDFDGKLTLLGWEVESSAGKGILKRGAEFTLRTYWRCEAAVPRSYKMFVHIDGPGPRVSGDHELLGGAYPTQHWNPGDYVRDVYTGSIAAVQERGSYTIRAGMYRGDSRLPIVGDAPAVDNSLLLGKVPLE